MNGNESRTMEVIQGEQNKVDRLLKKVQMLSLQENLKDKIEKLNSYAKMV